MARYIMTPVCNRKTAEGKTPLYPRVLIEHRTTTEELAHKIAKSTSFSKGDIIGIIETLAETLSSELASGNAVYLNGIGRFSPSLKLKGGVDPELDEQPKHRNAGSISIHSINFRPSKELITSCNLQSNLTRDTSKRSATVQTSRSERYTLAIQFMKQNVFLRVRDYEEITGLSANKASLELRDLYSEGLLSRRGRGTHIVYLAPDTTN